MSRTSRTPTRHTQPRRHAPLRGGLVVLAVVAVALLVWLANSRNPGRTVALPGFDPTLRTVVVASEDDTLPEVKSEQRFMMSDLRQGELPAGASLATVLTDTNCEPDAQGVSHCLNELQLESGRVTVQHHHAMMEVPCMSPGEQVNVISVETYHTLASS